MDHRLRHKVEALNIALSVQTFQAFSAIMRSTRSDTSALFVVAIAAFVVVIAAEAVRNTITRSVWAHHFSPKNLPQAEAMP